MPPVGRVRPRDVHRMVGGPGDYNPDIVAPHAHVVDGHRDADHVVREGMALRVLSDGQRAAGNGLLREVHDDHLRPVHHGGELGGREDNGPEWVGGAGRRPGKVGGVNV